MAESARGRRRIADIFLALSLLFGNRFFLSSSQFLEAAAGRGSKLDPGFEL